MTTTATAVGAAPQRPSPVSPPLRLEQVRYRYAGARAWALDGIDLEVAAGRVTAIMGPNDAGKSTLCLVAAGLAPTVIGGQLEGFVELTGTRTDKLKPHEAAQRCGILFQNPATQLSGTATTVWEEIAFGPRNLGLSLPDIVERVESAMAALRITPLAARDPVRLSGGQAQLVALASVLALRPACLVLDEPTSQLDPAGTRLVGAAIRRLAGEVGSAVLLVEHKSTIVAAMADELTILSGGRMVARGAVDEVFPEPAVMELGVEAPPGLRLRRALLAADVDGETTKRVESALKTLAAEDERHLEMVVAEALEG